MKTEDCLILKSDVQLLKLERKFSHLLDKSYISSKMDITLKMIDQIFEEYPEDKIIVVSQWTTMLELIGHHLKKGNFEYCIITGRVSLADRNDVLVDFNNPRSPVNIMLLSLKAGGVGLNIVGANHMFLLDIHRNPALEQQCSDRIYRVGQKKNVKIHQFICETTIEERINEVQQGKIKLAQLVYRDKEFNAGGRAMNDKLTINDFRLLFTEFPENFSLVNPSLMVQP